MDAWRVRENGNHREEGGPPSYNWSQASWLPTDAISRFHVLTAGRCIMKSAPLQKIKAGCGSLRYRVERTSSRAGVDPLKSSAFQRRTVSPTVIRRFWPVAEWVASA